MAMLTPTKDQGATAQPNEMLYVEPTQQVTPGLLAEVMAGTGLNGPFVADLLSAMLTHERCGRHLYRSVAARTNNPMLRGKYEEFGDETERHVEILETLVAACGGNPAYVSPQARVVQGMDTKLVESTFALGGSIDVMTQEMAMLDAVFLAESVDHANWKTLQQLVEHFPDGDLRDQFRAAVEEVEQQEDEHLGWAKQTKERLVILQARSELLATAGAKTEEMVARVRSWLS